MEVKNRQADWAAMALLLVNLIYGASHVIAKGVMPNYLTPTVFILFRVFGAVVLFWLSLSFVQKVKLQKNDLLRFGFCGLFGVSINQLLFFHGLNASSPMNAGIIMALNPIMVALLSFYFLKERLSSRQKTGIALGAIGAIALTIYGSTEWKARLGDLFLIGNSLSYAIYLILVKPLMNRYPPIQVIAIVFTFGSLFLLLFPPLYWDLANLNLSRIPMEVWIKIIFVIVGVTFLTYLLTVIGLRYVSPTLAAVFIYVQPIFVIVFSYVFSFIGWAQDYTKSINSTTIFLMALIFIGVYFTTNIPKSHET